MSELSLPSRLAKLAEFDEGDTIGPIDDYSMGFNRGLREQNARLQPLIAALIECAEALAKMTKYGANDVTIVTGEQALTRLEALAKDVK